MMTSSTTIEERQQVSDSWIRKVLTTKKYFMICESLVCFFLCVPQWGTWYTKVNATWYGNYAICKVFSL